MVLQADQVSADGVYTGPDHRIYNGISDTFKQSVTADTVVQRCNMQYSDATDDDGHALVRVHVWLVGTPNADGHGKGCSCGACGHTWKVVPPETEACGCEQGLMRQGEESCCIM